MFWWILTYLTFNKILYIVYVKNQILEGQISDLPDVKIIEKTHTIGTSK